MNKNIARRLSRELTARIKNLTPTCAAEINLLTLAAHLSSGKLGHKFFNFRVYNAVVEHGKICKPGSYNFTDETCEIDGTCGTVGCAIGEAPIVFPNHWEFSSVRGKPVLKGTGFSTMHSGQVFFDLTEQQYQAIFIPGYFVSVATQRSGYVYLDSQRADATKYDVASRIIDFCVAKYH